MPGLNIKPILDQLVSHAQASGYFDLVNTHEPKSAPGNGLTCSIVWSGTYPVGARSGLASVSARVEFLARIYSSMLAEPQDDIDPNLHDAADGLFTAYCGDFELGDTDQVLDIFGSHGPRMEAKPGYLEIDRKLYRFADIVIPVIVHDVWTEAP